MTITEAVAWLRERDDYLIITHIRPDGDTIGSGSALCCALKKIGKRAYLYNNPQFGDCYPWISAPYIAPSDFEPKYFVAVDTADVSMLPKGFDGEVDLCFDHHVSNTHYAKQTIVWSEKASCGELILAVVKELCGLDQVLADLLYVAVSTDTGCFVYGNTTGETFRAAAELYEAGASTKVLNKVLFRTSSKARLMLEGLVFSSLRFYHDGKTVIAIVTKEMLEKTGAMESDCQDLASLPGRVEGASTSILIKEVDAGHSKASVRTNGLVNANTICQVFGGGGHDMAAGCSIDKGCFEAAEALAAVVSEVM